MDFKKICYNCVKEKPTAEGVCPYCGFDNNTYKYSQEQLPPMTPLNGRYLLGRALGIGGFGITYIALDLHLQVVVAIKELYLKKRSIRENTKTITVNAKDVECFEDNKKRFLQEARVLAMFNEKENEGIVVVKEHFEENNTAYIVMEYLDGITLKKKVSEQKLIYEDVCGLLYPVCHALTRIHHFNVVHLDVSPDNIMIMPDGRAKLLDFGGAQNIEEKEESNFVAIKRGYAPPEQYTKKGNIGQWTDVYATAATIYYALTGVKPIDSMERLAGAELEKPSKLGVKIPAYAENALMKALEIEYERRFQSMEEFWSAFGNNVRVNGNKKIGAIVAGAIGVCAIVMILSGSFGNNNKEVVDIQQQEKIIEQSVTEQEIELQTEEQIIYEVGDYISVDLGTYVFENVADSSLVLGIDSGFGDDGAMLQIKSAVDKNSNRLMVTDSIEEDGFYNLQAAHTNSYIETADSSELGTVVKQYCDISNLGTEKWSFVYCGRDEENNRDLVIIENAAGTVLAPQDGILSAGTSVVLAEKNMNDDSQKWYMRWSEKNPVEEDVIVFQQGDYVDNISDVKNIISVSDGNTLMALTRSEWFTEPTAIVWENVWAENQKFEFVKQEENGYKLFPMDQLEGEHKCLEYDESSNMVVLREENDSAGQIFRIVYGGYNTFYFQTYNDLMLGFELGEDGTINGKAIHAYAYDAVGDINFIKWFIQIPSGE